MAKKTVKTTFDTELFKRSVLYNVRTLYRKTLEEATDQQIFQAVSYAIKDAVVDQWLTTQKEYDRQDPKMVYYLSMEFLMGRALGNNIINLQAYKAVEEALEELGIDINVVEDQEPDAALGNGGLGRLAACFLDSLASLNLPGHGNCIRYQYGLFKQEIVNNEQVELPDNWMKLGNVWEVRKPKHAVDVKFGGHVDMWMGSDGKAVRDEDDKLVYEDKTVDTELNVKITARIVVGDDGDNT